MRGQTNGPKSKSEVEQCTRAKPIIWLVRRRFEESRVAAIFRDFCNLTPVARCHRIAYSSRPEPTSHPPIRSIPHDSFTQINSPIRLASILSETTNGERLAWAQLVVKVANIAFAAPITALTVMSQTRHLPCPGSLSTLDSYQFSSNALKSVAVFSVAQVSEGDFWETLKVRTTRLHFTPPNLTRPRSALDCFMRSIP